MPHSISRSKLREEHGILWTWHLSNSICFELYILADNLCLISHYSTFIIFAYYCVPHDGHESSRLLIYVFQYVHCIHNTYIKLCQSLPTQRSKLARGDRIRHSIIPIAKKVRSSTTKSLRNTEINISIFCNGIR